MKEVQTEFYQRCIALECLASDIKKLETKENKTENDLKMISLETREYELLQHVTVSNISMYGCTIEEFRKELEKKPNVILFSDEELEEYRKALKIMSIL